MVVFKRVLVRFHFAYFPIRWQFGSKIRFDFCISQPQNCVVYGTCERARALSLFCELRAANNTRMITVWQRTNLHSNDIEPITIAYRAVPARERQSGWWRWWQNANHPVMKTRMRRQYSDFEWVQTIDGILAESNGGSWHGECFVNKTTAASELIPFHSLAKRPQHQLSERRNEQMMNENKSVERRDERKNSNIFIRTLFWAPSNGLECSPFVGGAEMHLKNTGIDSNIK